MTEIKKISSSNGQKDILNSNYPDKKGFLSGVTDISAKFGKNFREVFAPYDDMRTPLDYARMASDKLQDLCGIDMSKTFKCLRLSPSFELEKEIQIAETMAMIKKVEARSDDLKEDEAKWSKAEVFFRQLRECVNIYLTGQDENAHDLYKNYKWFTITFPEKGSKSFTRTEFEEKFPGLMKEAYSYVSKNEIQNEVKEIKRFQMRYEYHMRQRNSTAITP